MGSEKASLSGVMCKGGAFGLCVSLLATVPSLISTGFAGYQVLMTVSLVVAVVLLTAGFAAFAQLD